MQMAARQARWTPWKPTLAGVPMALWRPPATAASPQCLSVGALHFVQSPTRRAASFTVVTRPLLSFIFANSEYDGR
jgi:hypothetical protein